MTEQEKNDMLIRIDSNVAHLVQRIDKHDEVLGDHEERHRSCEKDRNQVKGGIKTATGAGAVAGGIIGYLVNLLTKH